MVLTITITTPNTMAAVMRRVGMIKRSGGRGAVRTQDGNWWLSGGSFSTAASSPSTPSQHRASSMSAPRPTPPHKMMMPFSTQQRKIVSNSCLHAYDTDHRRYFSSNIMGYSPMAPTGAGDVTNSGSTRIPTKDDVTLAGGVWAPTSAKRDKLAEYKASLSAEKGQLTLDDVATADQLQDLWLADGLKLIVQAVDTAGSDTTSSASIVTTNNQPLLDEFSTWLTRLQDDKAAKKPDLNQTELEAMLQVVGAKITTLLDRIPPNSCWMNVRDFLDPNVVVTELGQAVNSGDGDGGKETKVGMDHNVAFGQTPLSEFVSHQDNVHSMETFVQGILRYRLLLAQAAVQQLQESWTILTTVSDADIDRAAVQGKSIESQATSVSLSKVCDFIQSHVDGSCYDRVSFAWKLLDRDDDGLLNENEMNEVSYLAVKVEQAALKVLMEEVLDASSVRSGPPVDSPSVDDNISSSSTASTAVTAAATKPGWRQRRKERKVQKSLNRMFQRAVKKHFEDEVEINHRLRCIYAWANKHDQGNKIESVLVDGDGGSDGSSWTSGGRKRYVELSPKISLDEFREVQQLHFPHIDQVGVSIVNSFREDLWVAQGKGRERKELIRDSLLFLAVVSIADFVILSL